MKSSYLAEYVIGDFRIIWNETKHFVNHLEKGDKKNNFFISFEHGTAEGGGGKFSDVNIYLSGLKGRFTFGYRNGGDDRPFLSAYLSEFEIKPAPGNSLWITSPFSLIKKDKKKRQKNKILSLCARPLFFFLIFSFFNYRHVLNFLDDCLQNYDFMSILNV